MRTGPGLQAFPAGLAAFLGGLAAFSWQLGGFSWRPGGFSWRTKPKQNILFERFSAAYTKKVASAGFQNGGRAA